MPVSEQTYLQLALEDPGQWERHYGHLRRKPTMTAQHNEVAHELAFRLRQQLDRVHFTVRLSMGHVRRTAENCYISDVFVIPTELVRPLRGLRNVLEAYDPALPLVVEVWSPSTGEYDVDAELPECQRRGDLETWRVHPFDRTLTAWRRQPDGSHTEAHHTGGIVQPMALPNVTIDLDTLFE